MKRILAALLALITLLLPFAMSAGEERYEEHPMVSEGLKVYGRFYAPEGTEGPWPTVILSHGFGTMSMRYIAEQYHGRMAMEARNGIFRLYITLRKPAGDDGKLAGLQ